VNRCPAPVFAHFPENEIFIIFRPHHPNKSGNFHYPKESLRASFGKPKPLKFFPGFRTSHFSANVTHCCPFLRFDARFLQKHVELNPSS